MQVLAQARGPEEHGTLLRMIGVPRLLPARAVMRIGLWLVFRDGVAVLLGLATAGLAFFVTAGLVLMVRVWGSGWITRWGSTNQPLSTFSLLASASANADPPPAIAQKKAR